MTFVKKAFPSGKAFDIVDTKSDHLPNWQGILMVKSFVLVKITFIAGVKVTSADFDSKLFLQKAAKTMNWCGLLRLFIGMADIIINVPFAGATSSSDHFSVLINEFLPDPDPSAGLPAASFIELKNVSLSPVSLQGWTISNGKTAAEIRTEIILQPDSFLILCPVSAADDYRLYGYSVGVKGFPAPGHLSGEIILTDEVNQVIDAVAYDLDWFNDPVKAEGGWSLARVDPTKPCSGRSNWTASIDPVGGTPGRPNNDVADHAANAGDETAATFVRSYCPDSTHILLLLNGPLDVAGAASVNSYQVSPSVATISSAAPVPPFFDQVLLTLDAKLAGKQIYQVNIAGLSSCGTAIPDAMIRTGLPGEPDSGDVLFNEILFNPPSYGSDYIELYHAGRNIIDLKNCQLASRDNTGGLKDPRAITTAPWLFFPDDYLVVTENKEWVQKHYLVKNPEQLLELPQLPSMPDDKGIIVLLNNAGQKIDELPYNHQWQSPLIADESGVALEKTGVRLLSALPGSWTSAASTAGYGTPTYLNSESGAAGYDSVRSGVFAVPVVFSPDNDGYNDFCFVTVRPQAPGFTANIIIYDINGIAIKTLAANATMGNEGRFRWDGSGDAGNPLPTGRYVVFTEIFSLTGTVRRYKNVVVLARNRRL